MKRVLSIAGSDSGGGAGIQADIKAITVLGGYAMTAVTAVTAQNTRGVQAIHSVPPAFVREQIEAVIDDIGVDAVKTGMLGAPGVVRVVAETLARRGVDLVVVDPVMVATSGDTLLSQSARAALVADLLPLALLVTPNLPEAEALVGKPVNTVTRMKEAAEAISAMGPRYVLVKGGHLPGDPVDVLYDGTRFHAFTGRRIDTRNTHGTGCTYSAAIATFLAAGDEVVEAVQKARTFLTRAIETGVDIGRGHGPTNPYGWLAERLAPEGRPTASPPAE